MKGRTRFANGLPGCQPPQTNVSLVGAGPGDPGLLTLKALDRIQRAEVVLFDALVNEAILALLPADCQRISVGKRAGHHSSLQPDINELLLQHAASGRYVVRLKGGDPFIFGRGGEELLALATAGYDCEVIPGITAASGCAASVGIPLTHRTVAQGATIVTGHCRQDGAAPDWAQLAAVNHTLIVYMGLMKAADISAALVGHGRPADTPVAVVEKGCTPAQRVHYCTLASLASTIAQQQVAAPGLIIIGDVVSIAEQIQTSGHELAAISNVG